MNKNIEILFNLIRENPTLPVIPMVDSDIVCEDWGRWMGSFGEAYLGEYTCFNERFYSDREDFEEDYFDYNSEELCEKFNYQPLFNANKCTEEWLNEHKKTEKKIDEYLHEVSNKYFKDAIIVNINTPDE